MAGLANPACVIFPDNPGAGGLDALAEYEQCAYLWAGGITGAPVVPPTPTPEAAVEVAAPGLGLWHVPFAGKRVYLRFVGTLPLPTMRALLRTYVPPAPKPVAPPTPKPLRVRFAGVLPSPQFLGRFSVGEPPAAFAVRGIMQMPPLEARMAFAIENDEEQIAMLLAAYFRGRP